MVVVISALLDGFSLVDWIVDKVFYAETLLCNIGYIGSTVIILGFAIYVIFILLKNDQRNK